jgi:hypothetical protein
MARLNRRGITVALMAALGMMASSGREACAELTLKGGIVQTGGGSQTGDPPYNYQIEVNLSGTIDAFTFPYTQITTVTINGLVGVDTNSVFSYAGLQAYVGWQDVIIDTTSYENISFTLDGKQVNESVPISSVTWMYTGSSTITAPPGNPLLGYLMVQTDPNLTFPTASPPYPTYIPNTVTDSYSLDGGSNTPGNLLLTPGGIYPAVLGVPEPSTVIAPIVALLGLGLGRLLRRRDG